MPESADPHGSAEEDRMVVNPQTSFQAGSNEMADTAFSPPINSVHRDAAPDKSETVMSNTGSQPNDPDMAFKEKESNKPNYSASSYFASYRAVQYFKSAQFSPKRTGSQPPEEEAKDGSEKGDSLGTYLTVNEAVRRCKSLLNKDQPGTEEESKTINGTPSHCSYSTPPPQRILLKMLSIVFAIYQNHQLRGIFAHTVQIF